MKLFFRMLCLTLFVGGLFAILDEEAEASASFYNIPGNSDLDSVLNEEDTPDSKRLATIVTNQQLSTYYRTIASYFNDI